MYDAHDKDLGERKKSLNHMYTINSVNVPPHLSVPRI